MSMKDVACSGFIVKASALTPLLSATTKTIYEKAIEDGNDEKVRDILRMHLPENMPTPEDVFVANAEMTTEDFEEGDIVVIFADSDLFITQKTPALENMEKAGVSPQFARWTVWC